MKNKIIFSLILITVSLSVMGRAFVAVPKATPAPKVDGKIDPGKEWKEAVSLTNFTDIDKGIFAFKQTRVWLCHDLKNLYLAFKLYDSNLLHASNMMSSFKNDLKGSGQKVWTDDCLEIRLLPPWVKKTKGFSHFYLAFNANAATLSYAPKGYNQKWELKCKVKTNIEEGFWQAEIKIPLSALTNSQINVNDFNKWKFNFIRFEQSTKSRSSWNIICDKKHSSTKYMAKMQLVNVDVPALKIPDITNGNVEEIILPYFSKTRFRARFWPYPWLSSLGQTSRERYKKCNSSLLVFKKGLGKQCLKTAIPAKGTFFFKYNITYGKKGQTLYQSPDYSLNSDRQTLTFNSKSIEKVTFNGTKLLAIGTDIKLNPTQGLNVLTLKSKNKNISLDQDGEIMIPLGLKWKTKGDIHTLKFYNKISTLTLPGINKKIFPVTAGDAYGIIWEAAKTRSINITENPQSMALNLLLPESVKVIGVSSNNKYPNGFAEEKIKPYINIYKVINKGTVNIGDENFVHYIISTNKLKKYINESPRSLEKRTRCAIVIKAEKTSPKKGLKFYYYANIGKEKESELINSCDLLVLPKLNGKQPKKCRFTIYQGFFNGISNRKIMNAIYSRAAAVGAGEVYLTNMIDQGKYKLKKTDFFQMETYAWRKSTLEMKNIFKKFPKSRCENGGYSKYANLSYISRHPEIWPLLEEEISNIRKREPNLTGLCWDYEFLPLGHYADFSSYTLELFAKNYGINEKLDKKVIKEKYINQWIDFRCKELGKISSILKRIANKYGFEFNFYAAGAMKSARVKYSIDINELSADRLYLGGTWFSEDTKKIKELSQEKRIPLSFSVHMCKTAKTGWKEATILRRIVMNNAGGVLFWYELGFDGMQLTAIANITRLVEKYENFFQNGKVQAFGMINNKLIYSRRNLTSHKVQKSLLGDIANDKVALFVYELDGKFLALLINPSSKKVNISLNFKKSKGKVREFYSKKEYQSNKEYIISLEASKVAAFVGSI